MNNQSLKVGVVQQAVASNDKDVNWARSAEQVRVLAEQGCELIMLQELHSTLYFCQ
ncbi:MAG: N-carbamoylputrescine amidase, partial [Flavobacteriales bacterium]